LPHVTSPQALVPAHVTSQSALPHVTASHAAVPVQWIAQEAASVQSTVPHAESVHVMSHWWPSGQWTFSPLSPVMMQVGGLAFGSQPPLQMLGQTSWSITQ
jgi:hypothetical protein